MKSTVFVECGYNGQDGEDEEDYPGNGVFGVHGD